MKDMPPVLTFIMLLLPAIFLSCKTAHTPIEYKPNNEKGPVIIILSGQTGPDYYHKFASELGGLGYYVVMHDSNVFKLRDHTACESKLSEIIHTATRSPNALPGRVAIIGYSMGGGIALAYASNRPELVSLIIAYYPMTFYAGLGVDINALPERFKVPITVFQGGSDYHFLNCCSADRISKISELARKKGADFNLVIYPNAGHGFNLATILYDKTSDEDSWEKTIQLLKKRHPLPAKKD
jgi:pimeloyl-ACP methyl ester carboxylesterase